VLVRKVPQQVVKVAGRVRQPVCMHTCTQRGWGWQRQQRQRM
jgi:hypothetical protein